MYTRGRQVKLILSRMEEFTSTTCRHPTKIHVRNAVSNDGRIIGREITVVYGGGAYSVAGNVTVRNAVYAISSVYNIPNVRAEIYIFWLTFFLRLYLHLLFQVEIQHFVEPYAKEIVPHLGRP